MLRILFAIPLSCLSWPHFWKATPIFHPCFISGSNSFFLAFLVVHSASVWFSYAQFLTNEECAFIYLFLIFLMVSRLDFGSSNRKQVNTRSWARAMSGRTITYSSATPSVFDWLFFFGRGGFLHIKLEAEDQPKKDAFFFYRSFQTVILCSN